jgi:uncharacterized protein YkwD
MSTWRRGQLQWIAGSMAAAGLMVLAPAASASGSSARSTQPPRAHIALGLPQPPVAHIALRHGGNQPTCADANAPATHTSKQALRTAVVCLINRQRALHHLPSLGAQPRLDRSAQAWTNTMVATGQFTHGLNFAARISAAGFQWSSAGENIATGYRTPRQAVTAWMASTGHCENILNPSFANVGTGVIAHPVGHFARGPATWTQDFGLWMGHQAPSGDTGPASGCPYHI